MMCNGFALRNRFDGLPLHKICYYHSHDSAEVAIRSLSSELETQSSSISRASRGIQDCLGMTPLHILACSTKHHLAMYQMLLSKYPEHLIYTDAWGDTPLLYTLWGRAPREIVELLITTMKEKFTDTGEGIDWTKMIETLCRGLAPIASIDYLIEMNAKHFPEQNSHDIDWNSTVKILCTKGKAQEKRIQEFVQHYRVFLVDVEQVSLELAREEKFGFKPFWLRIGISDRLLSIKKENAAWQQKIETMINSCPTGGSERNVKRRYELMQNILRKLDYYETVAQMWVLELALWKFKLQEMTNNEDPKNKSYRSRCQFTSGADVIIPNVMEYLLI
jgi:hypothetical protein